MCEEVRYLILFSPYIYSIIFISHSFVVSLTKTVVYISSLFSSLTPLSLMSIDLKKALFMETKPNPRLERFKDIKSFYLSHKAEVPPRVLEEYSDILD